MAATNAPPLLPHLVDTDQFRAVRDPGPEDITDSIPVEPGFDLPDPVQGPVQPPDDLEHGVPTAQIQVARVIDEIVSALRVDDLDVDVYWQTVRDEAERLDLSDPGIRKAIADAVTDRREKHERAQQIYEEALLTYVDGTEAETIALADEFEAAADDLDAIEGLLEKGLGESDANLVRELIATYEDQGLPSGRSGRTISSYARSFETPDYVGRACSHYACKAYVQRVTLKRQDGVEMYYTGEEKQSLR
jgi:hypothetical protein